MRIAALGFLIALPFAATCGHSHDGFDTLQACYDEHHNREMLSIQQSIVVCCLDHPVDGVNPSCTDTQATCVSHVDAALDDSVTMSDIQAACTEYINQK